MQQQKLWDPKNSVFTWKQFWQNQHAALNIFCWRFGIFVIVDDVTKEKNKYNAEYGVIAGTL